MGEIIKHVKKGDTENPIYVKKTQIYKDGTYTGTTEGFTLDKNLCEFNELEIEWRTTDYEYHLTRVVTPRTPTAVGKVALNITKLATENTYLVIFSAVLQLTENTISFVNNGRVWYDFSTKAWSTPDTTGQIYITSLTGLNY